MVLSQGPKLRAGSSKRETTRKTKREREKEKERNSLQVVSRKGREKKKKKKRFVKRNCKDWAKVVVVLLSAVAASDSLQSMGKRVDKCDEIRSGRRCSGCTP